jgi:outer membrane protein assembly factor BamB
MYRARVDVQAEKWLQDGLANRDARPLRRVVEEAFCSRPGARALDVLGDLAFERGDFDQARSWWGMLIAPVDRDGEKPALVYPDPALDLARVQAKQILARVFAGEPEQAERELELYRKRHPGSAGLLGGRQGVYADLVQSFLEPAGGKGPAAEATEWPTFAGAASRNRTLPDAPSRRLWAGGPTWRVRLDDGNARAVADPPLLTSAKSTSQLPMHPIIQGGKVFVADTRQVLGFHLRTGQLLFRHVEAQAPQDRSGKSSTDLVTKHTLTISENRIYACVGAALLGPGKEGARVEPGASYLICLDVPADARAVGGPVSLQERWRVQADGPRGVPTVFEGAPLLHQGSVLVALTGLAGVRAQTSIACYDAATGALRWRQDLCDSPEYEDQPAPRNRRQLLTLAGTQVVYCSHAGALVALDALTGRRTWAVRYPVRGPRLSDSESSSRDAGPCVYDGSRLFAAPADSDRVLCLDPQTGRVLWERDGVELTELLGVARRRLIFTTPNGIRALNAATGSDRGGWTQPDEGKLPGRGRGFLAAGWVFWPTQDPRLPLRALNVEDGSQERGSDAFEPTELRTLVAGNFAVGGGCLVSADAEELLGYVPGQGLPEHPRPGTGSAAAKVKGTRPLFPGNRPRAELHPGHLQRKQERRAPPTNLASTRPRELKLPLLRSWDIEAGRLLIPAAGTAHNRAEEEVFFVKDRILSCHEAASGILRWRQSMAFEPTWLASVDDGIVIAGSTGIQRLNSGDGQAHWEIKTLDKPEEPLASEPLSGFQQAGSRLYCFYQRHCLLALDLETGQLTWSFWAPAAKLRPLGGGGEFQPFFHAGPERIVLQTSGGRLLILSSATGQKLHQGATASSPWPQPPLPRNADHVALVESARRVGLLNTATGKTEWTYQPRLPASLTGGPPQLFGNRDALFLLVPLNIGDQLERLDPANGKHVWPDARRLSKIGFDGTTIDATAVYACAGQELQARLLGDGKLLWVRLLPAPGGPWQVVCTNTFVAAYPLPSFTRMWNRASRLPVVLPVGFSRVGLSLPGSFVEGENSGFHVLLFDPHDGKLLQRLNFTTAWPWAAVQVFPHRLIVAAEGHAWGLVGGTQ